MSNYCATYITIRGDEKQVRTLYQFMEWAYERASKTKRISEIGDLLGVVDIRNGSVYKRGTDQYISSRSSVEQLNYDGANELGISVGDAWNPQLGVYMLLKEKFAPDCEFTYIAEEPGCDVYVTNDPEYVNKWIVEVFDDNSELESQWYVSEDEAREFLQRILHSNSDDMDELTKLAYESDEYELSVHFFSEVQPEDYCD